MPIIYHQMIAILPLLIIGFTIVLIMLSIAWKRNCFLSVSLAVTGLSLTLLSLYFVKKISPTDITSLIRIDNFFIFYAGLLIVSSLAISILAYTWLIKYHGNRDEFYLLMLIATLGSILLTSANHFIIFFMGIELISLPLFGMIGYTFHQKYSLEASIKYMLLSSIASSFLLFGMALVYAKTGYMSFHAIAQTISNDHTILKHPVFLTGLGMIIVALGIKLSLTPFHLWTPDVYQGVSAPVLFFLTAISKIAIFSVIIRLFLYIPFTYSNTIRLALIIMSSTSMLFGNIMALHQNNIKRLLGYSSISQMSYPLVGLIEIQSHTLALESIGIYLAGYLFASLGVCSVINIISSLYIDENYDSIYSYRGLFWYNPLLSFAMTIMIFSMAGIPMTVGFIGKFYITALTINGHLLWLTSAIIFSSIIGLLYYLRLIVNLYLTPSIIVYPHKASNWMLANNINMLILIFSLLAVLLLGLYPQLLIKFIRLSQPL